jgi:tetratricopeptide (TPR) repeat protein
VLQAESPRDPAGYVQASFALDALGRTDEALVELETGAARLPGDPAVLAKLGSRHLAARRFSQAKTIFDGIVARDAPAAVLKHVLAARALEGQSRFQEAIREAQTARDIAPADPRALTAFARLAAVLGRYDDAIDATELAARLPGAKPGQYDAQLVQLRAAREEQKVRRAVQGAR